MSPLSPQENKHASSLTWSSSSTATKTEYRNSLEIISLFNWILILLMRDGLVSCDMCKTLVTVKSHRSNRNLRNHFLLLLFLYSVPRGLSSGSPVFPSHQKPTFEFVLL